MISFSVGDMRVVRELSESLQNRLQLVLDGMERDRQGLLLLGCYLLN